MLDPSKSETQITETPVVRPATDLPERPEIIQDVEPEGPFSYRMKLGRQVIRLDPAEYRILCFLAAKPYHAFTPRQIALGASTELHPVLEQTLDRHIASLRQKLGFFSDYIQRVPYIGYRFKA